MSNPLPSPPFPRFRISHHPIKLCSKCHWLRRRKSVPSMPYLQKCDAGPKMCDICNFNPKNIAFLLIDKILHFLTHMYSILLENPQQQATKRINNARIEQNISKQADRVINLGKTQREKNYFFLLNSSIYSTTQLMSLILHPFIFGHPYCVDNINYPSGKKTH